MMGIASTPDVAALPISWSSSSASHRHGSDLAELKTTLLDAVSRFSSIAAWATTRRTTGAPNGEQLASALRPIRRQRRNRHRFAPVFANTQARTASGLLECDRAGAQARKRIATGQQADMPKEKTV
jgi:hypothetical protein